MISAAFQSQPNHDLEFSSIVANENRAFTSEEATV